MRQIGDRASLVVRCDRRTGGGRAQYCHLLGNNTAVTSGVPTPQHLPTLWMSSRKKNNVALRPRGLVLSQVNYLFIYTISDHSAWQGLFIGDRHTGLGNKVDNKTKPSK